METDVFGVEVALVALLGERDVEGHGAELLEVVLGARPGDEVLGAAHQLPVHEADGLLVELPALPAQLLHAATEQGSRGVSVNKALRERTEGLATGALQLIL